MEPCRGLAKNATRAFTELVLANIYLGRRRCWYRFVLANSWGASRDNRSMTERFLLRAFDREIVERGPAIEFGKRPAGPLVVAGITFFVAACTYGAGQWLVARGGELGPLGSFLNGVAGLLVVVGVLVALGGVFLAMAPARRVFARIDAAARICTVRGRRVPFAEVRCFSVEPMHGAMRALTIQTADAGSVLLWAATAAQVDVLQALAPRLNAMLGPAPASTPHAPEPASATPSFERRFRSQVILAIGALWTVGGFFFFRGLLFASRLTPETSFPVWMVGPAILVVGAIAWLRARRS